MEDIPQGVFRALGTSVPSAIMERKAPREDQVQELKRMSEGWDHLGKPKLAADTAVAALELESGASSVQAGHTTYIVTD